MNDQPRKICYDELFDKFKESAQQWLKEIPELRGLMLVVDWKVGQNDFPPCSVVCERPTEQTTIDMMRQALKLSEQLGNMFRQQIEHIDSVVHKATEQVKQKLDNP